MVLSEINVTPLVDVMLVLLVVFMITAPMMQQGIDIELPETAASGIETLEDPLELVIKKDGKLYVGEQVVETKSLRTKLKAIMETRKNKQIYVQADKRVDYGLVAEVIAEVKGAGIQSIGLVTLPK